jgi:hypothetical protein
MTLFWVIDTTCRVPPGSTMMGEAHALSPVAVHLTAPDFASKAVNGPKLPG